MFSCQLQTSALWPPQTCKNMEKMLKANEKTVNDLGFKLTHLTKTEVMKKQKL